MAVSPVHSLIPSLPRRTLPEFARPAIIPLGGMTEWLMVAVLKTAGASPPSGVRIPVPPHECWGFCDATFGARLGPVGRMERRWSGAAQVATWNPGRRRKVSMAAAVDACMSGHT